MLPTSSRRCPPPASTALQYLPHRIDLAYLCPKTLVIAHGPSENKHQTSPQARPSTDLMSQSFGCAMHSWRDGSTIAQAKGEERAAEAVPVMRTEDMRKKQRLT
jgi:hypothetical protein